MREGEIAGTLIQLEQIHIDGVQTTDRNAITMFDAPALARTPDRMDTLRRWLPRIVISMFFLNVGAEKFSAGQWINIFGQIGAGDWLRYATGWLQIGGAVLLLIPTTVLIGVAMLALTMVGAMLAWIFVLGSPGSAVFPGILLTILFVIGLRRRSA